MKKLMIFCDIMGIFAGVTAMIIGPFNIWMLNATCWAVCCLVKDLTNK